MHTRRFSALTHLGTQGRYLEHPQTPPVSEPLAQRGRYLDSLGVASPAAVTVASASTPSDNSRSTAFMPQNGKIPPRDL